MARSELSVITKEAKEEYSKLFSSEISRLDLLEESRLRNLYCDFVIKAGNKRWNCHKNVLVGTSPYFRTILASAYPESSTGELEFPEYMSDSLDIVLKYMYTGSIKISVSNVVAVRRVGSYLVINDLDDICVDFINRNFELVSKSDGFLSLEWAVFARIIASYDQQVNEQCVWEAVMKWVKHDLKNRSKVLPEFMEHVRFDLITTTYLCQNIAQDDLVKSSTECKDFIYEVLASRLTQSKDEEMNVSKSRCRMEDIYVIGGEHIGRVTNYVLKYSSQAGAKWCQSQYDENKHLTLFGAIVVDNYLYTVGGSIFNGCIVANKVEMFDSKMNKWSKVSQLNASRAALGVCSVSNTIYACGGKDSKSYTMNSVEFCDLGIGCWKTTTPMNARRGHVKVVFMKGSIWALGGQSDDGKALSSVEQYDPREGWWCSHQKSMLTARADHDAVVLDGNIYVCGGDSFEEYDPRNKKWRLLSPMKHSRSYASLVVYEGNIWAIGGYRIGTVEIYDRRSSTWTMGTPLPWMLSKHCAVILPHSI